MGYAMSQSASPRDPSWAWDEPRWRGAVAKVRAGRSLRPPRWKDGARVCVALSFDSDHETSTLRDYELLEDGTPTGIVELPVECIKDDAPYFGMNRASTLRPYTSPASVLEIFKAEFDGAVAEGGLFLLTMHPHIIGHRSRIALLAQLVEHMKRVDGVWFATHEEVARYCRARA
jgi:hypothetical protein